MKKYESIFNKKETLEESRGSLKVDKLETLLKINQIKPTITYSTYDGYNSEVIFTFFENDKPVPKIIVTFEVGGLEVLNSKNYKNIGPTQSYSMKSVFIEFSKSFTAFEGRVALDLLYFGQVLQQINSLKF